MSDRPHGRRKAIGVAGAVVSVLLARHYLENLDKCGLNEVLEPKLQPT